MQKNTHISVVIPSYNERQSLEELYKLLCDSLHSIKTPFDLIFVDDGSTDDTFKILQQIQSTSHEKITLIRLRKNTGKSAALAVGFEKAKGNIIVTIDADLQDDPYEIPKLIKKLNAGYDVVSGWRINRHDTWQKRLPSKFFNWFVGKITGIKIHDFNTGLKVYKQQVIKEISLYGELHRYIPVLAVSRGFKIAEVPIHHHTRKYGTSKYGIRRIFLAGFDFLGMWLLINFKGRSMQFFGIAGGIFMIIALILFAYTLILYFSGDSGEHLLLICVLLVLFSVQLISTGYIAKLVTSYHQREMNFPIDEIIE